MGLRLRYVLLLQVSSMHSHRKQACAVPLYLAPISGCGEAAAMGPKSAMEPMVRVACGDDDVPQGVQPHQRDCMSWRVAPCYQPEVSLAGGRASTYWPAANLQEMESKIPRCKGS